MAGEPESHIVTVTLQIVRLLEELGVPYVIGGSLASSIHGTMRSTHDVDFVVDLKAEHVQAFAKGLGDGFYVSESRMTESVATGRSFNVIALDPMFKVDFFVASGKPFETSQLRRGEAVRVSRETDVRVKVLTPEDVVIAKLAWYRKGGEVSDRQWEDVLGVMRVQAGALDEGYLAHMAEEVGVRDLLGEALDEASESEPDPDEESER